MPSSGSRSGTALHLGSQDSYPRHLATTLRTGTVTRKGVFLSPTHSKSLPSKELFLDKHALKRLNKNLKSLYEDLMSPNKGAVEPQKPRTSKKQM